MLYSLPSVRINHRPVGLYVSHNGNVSSSSVNVNHNNDSFLSMITGSKFMDASEAAVELGKRVERLAIPKSNHHRTGGSRPNGVLLRSTSGLAKAKFETCNACQ